MFRLIVMAAVTLAALPAAPPTQDVKYGIGTWDPESGLGNHRAVVRVEALPREKGWACRSRKATGSNR